LATAKPPDTIVPVEAVDDVASPLAPNVAIPLTDNELPRLAAPVTPIVVPTYKALAIAVPPPITTPPETDDEDASPGEEAEEEKKNGKHCENLNQKYNARFVPIKTYQTPKKTQSPIQPRYCPVTPRQSTSMSQQH
jgi:hypothetical protein